MTDRPWDEPPQPGEADVTRAIPRQPRPQYGDIPAGVPGGVPGQVGPGEPGHDAGPTGPPEDPVPEEEPSQGWVVPLLSSLAALAVGLLVGWLVWSSGDDDSALQAEADRLTAENADLREQVDSLTGDLEALQSEGEEGLAELTAQNEELSAQVESLTGEVEGLTTDNDGLTEQVADLEAENTQLQERIDQILTDLDDAMVAAPSVVGGTSESAAEVAEENGWLLVQIPSATDQVAAGTVVAQTPPAGTPMLSGSALVVSVAAEPDPAPEPDAESVFDAEGTGPGTTDVVELAGGTRHVLAYSFTGDGQHTVTVVDADDNPVAVLADVNGTAEGATGLPLAGSYRLQVDTGESVEWNLRVVALP